MMRPPMTGDIDAAVEPNMVVGLGVGDEPLQGGDPAGPADQAAVQAIDIIRGVVAPSAYSTSKVSRR